MSYKEKIKDLACLVPDKSKLNKNSTYLSCHEKTLCDCEVLEIVEELEQQLKQRDELIKEIIHIKNGTMSFLDYEIRMQEFLNKPEIQTIIKKGNK